MLSVQSPLQLAMPNDNVHDDGHAAWNAWRAPTNLPTPPSSDPPRRLGTAKQHFAVDHSTQQRVSTNYGVHAAYQQHLTLPPIKHLDRHWPDSSPLTPPDDDMHSSPLSLSTWRDAKPGPSRLHSPMNSNTPFLASPSPSPVDEDERYDEHYDVMDERPELEEEPGNQDWDWDWQQQEVEGGIERQHDMNGESDYSQMQSSASGPSNHTAVNSSAADWVTNPSQRSAHFIAEKTCEMVCYLWFSSSLGPRAVAASRARRERERSQRRRSRDSPAHRHSPPYASRSLSNASTAALQFCASPEFVAFMAKLLATTQVSQSVIVLSLHYIFRLKERNDFTLGKPGSEFRVAVCALMLANKFVDDNTYTNKTWSEVSAIPLEELNKMEREFLLGVGFRLFVDAQTYDAWLNLLKGLVLTKEREYSRWRERRRARVIVPRIRIPDANDVPSRNVQQEQQRTPQRARSTSPHHSRNYSYAPAYPFTFTIPSSSTTHFQATQSLSAQASPDRPVTSKRTAADAFSPTSVTFAGAVRGGKRPTGLALDIPAALASASSRAGSVSAHPAYTYADSLRRLENMSITTPVDQQTSSDTMGETERFSEETRESEEQTLAAPYRGVDAVRRAPPPHLYFYTLASSPLPSPYSASDTARVPAELSATHPSSVDIAEELHAPKGSINVLPPGAERKARLRYVDSHTADGYGCDYNVYGYRYATTQAPYYSQDERGQQAIYPTAAPAPIAAHRSSASLSSNAYTQSQLHTQQPNSVAQHIHEHHQCQQPQHLPPLALALSMSSASTRAPIAQTQSASTSPLPGFASLDAYALPPAPSSHTHSQYHSHQTAHNMNIVNQAYSSDATFNEPSTSYAHTSALAPAVQSAWSAPPSETVDGVYAPVPRHVRPHSHSASFVNQQHRAPYLPAPSPYKSYVHPACTYPPSQQDSLTNVTATSLAGGSGYTSHGQILPERAAFANAGPPGVANFYPYTRSGSLSAADACGNAYNSNVASGQSVGMVQQSQSVTASPEGPYVYDYNYAVRGRQL